MNKEVDDLFENKKKKKKTKEEKRLEKIMKKQEQLNNEKKETDKYLEDSVKFKKIENEKPKEEIKKELKRETKEPTEKLSVIDFLYDTLFGFVTILLFLTSIGYLVYNYYKNNTLNNLILEALLVATGLFYMITMFAKQDKTKKIFGILSSLSLMGFMAFELFII